MKTCLILLASIALPHFVTAQAKKVIVGANITAYLSLDNDKGTARAWVAGPGDMVDFDLQKDGTLRHIKVEDFNFDGLKDFAVVSTSAAGGTTAERYEIFLYSPSGREFQPLEVPGGESTCDGFYNVKLMAATRTLTSTCHTQGNKKQQDFFKYTDAFTLVPDHTAGGEEIVPKEPREKPEQPEKEDKDE